VAAAPAAAPTAAASDTRVAALEARCAQLRQDVDHIAIFARALLTLLEEKGVASEEQFQEALRKLEAKQAPSS
jgi:hypothetical protein